MRRRRVYDHLALLRAWSPARLETVAFERIEKAMAAIAIVDTMIANTLSPLTVEEVDFLSGGIVHFAITSRIPLKRIGALGF